MTDSPGAERAEDERQSRATEDAALPLSLSAFFSRMWRRGSNELAESLENGDRIARLHALRTLPTLSARRLHQLEPSLLRLFETAEPEVTDEARRVLRALYGLDRLQRRMEHGSAEERVVAVRILGALRHEATIPILFSQAASADAAVRDAAIVELVAIGDDQVICGAIEALQRSDPGAHGAAVHVLRAMGDAATSLLVGALGAPQREVRFGAIKALEVMGASQACPHLVPLLGDPVEEIRAQAARVLAMMRHREALPQLVRAVNDPAQSVRVEAATALALFGGTEAVQGLVNFLSRCAADAAFEVADQDFLTAVAAMPDLPASGYLTVLTGENQTFAISLAVALEDAGTVNRWLQSLTESPPDERRALIELLQRVAELGVREPFVEGLTLPDPELRGMCAWVLGSCRHSEAVPQIVGLLADTSALVRRRAVEALGAIQDSASARALSDALGDPDREVRAAAVAALAEMIETGAISVSHGAELALAEGDQPALPSGEQPALPAALPSSYSLPARVTDVLGGLARSAAAPSQQLGIDGMLSSTSALVRALHDPAENVRAQVSEALGRLGIDSAAPELLDRALHDNSPQVRTSAARALTKLNAADAAPALIKHLQHHDSDLRRRAAEALGELGDPLAGAALIAALEDPVPPVRQKAARALWQIADVSLAEPLREHLHNPDPRIRAAVTGIFGKLRALQALDAIANRLEDPNKYVRASALNALAKIGEEGRPVQRRVVRLLSDRDSFVRARAAEALARMGEPGDEETRALMGALDDDADEVRVAARAGLLGLANSGTVASIVQALTDEPHHHHARAILLETNLGIMRTLLTTAKQVNNNVGRMLLDIVSEVLRQRGSIEDCRRDLMSLDPTVRLAGLEALALLRNSEAVDLIAGALFNDPLPALREKAATILSEFDDPAALAALKRAREVIPQGEESPISRPGRG